MKRMMAGLFLLLLCTAPAGHAAVSVRTVDLLAAKGLSVNAAGPILVKTDAGRNRLLVANALSSSFSIVDGATGSVTNIPLGGRALQHLKAECLTWCRRTGEVALIGARTVCLVSVDAGKATTIPTEVQFESVAIDEATGNVFVAGRESASLGMVKPASGKLVRLPWLTHREDLVNLNATPPPPIRKVVAAPELGRIVAVDGFTSTLHQFDGASGRPVTSRSLPLASGGRWHLAGYDERDHSLYLVIETAGRRVIEAARIDVLSANDQVVGLPGLTEGVGIIYNPARREVYIPYDNHPTVHAVSFEDSGSVAEIKVPAYGNDASAVDEAGDRLYIGSWAFGEVDVIDLAARRLVRRIEGLGIIPHMFAMTFNPRNGRLYFPKGATAVNGAFGAALTALDPESGVAEKVYLGWAPVDFAGLPGLKRSLVFNSEDEFAVVRPEGSFVFRRLPAEYPVAACPGPGGSIYLSYGPHQSYWPVVYIWGARNGILTIGDQDLDFYDRRIPRQAQRLVLREDGALCFTQNNWGREEAFVGFLPDEVRAWDPQYRIAFADTVDREITQRILEYDRELSRLYLVRLPEKDDAPSVLNVIDAAGRKLLARIPLGHTATDLVFDGNDIHVSNFDSRSVSVIDRRTFACRELPAGDGPLKLCRAAERLFVINHRDGTLQEIGGAGTTRRIPFEGRPDNLFAWGERLVLTCHSPAALALIGFDPAAGTFEILHRAEYPYGDTRFDSRNVSFFVPGQFGDALFAITRGRTDPDGRLWVTDFLSGRLFILSRG